MTWYRKLAFAAIILAMMAGILYFSEQDAPGVLILEYHRVNDSNDDEYTITNEDFQKQIEYLISQGYQTISLMDFVRSKKYGEILPDKSLILTFDDGYEDNYTNVMPFLKKHDMKETVFVITNRIGQDGYLSWEQLHEMQSENVELGSHSANHLPLATLPPEKITDEIHLSKLLMEWKGLKTIYFFSYPNGSYNAASHEALIADGYLGAVTGDAGLSSASTDPYLLQRMYIPRSKLGLLDFKLRLFKSNLYTKFNIKQNTI